MQNRDIAHRTEPGPRQLAVLEHAKLISHFEVEFEESHRHPHNRSFTTQEMAQAALNDYVTLTHDAIHKGHAKMAKACSILAAHIIDKYDFTVPPTKIRYVSAITEGGVTRHLTHAIRVF